MYTHTRHTHKYTVNMCRLNNGAEIKTKTNDNKKNKTNQKIERARIYLPETCSLMVSTAWWSAAGSLLRPTVVLWCVPLQAWLPGASAVSVLPCIWRGRTENHCLGFVGLSHTGSRLCVPDQSVTAGSTGRQWPVCRSSWSWSRSWWIRLATPKSGSNSNEKTGRALIFIFYFLKLYLFRLSQRRVVLDCLYVLSR